MPTTWSFPRLAPLLCVVLLLWPGAASAQVVLQQRFEGAYDYRMTGATLRTQANSGDACAVAAQSTATLPALPAGATVHRAFLYWAASRSTIDATATLNGTTVNAVRTDTATYPFNGSDINYYGAVADVTSRVTGGGSYTVGGISISTSGTWCTPSAVAGGWALLVIYNVPGTGVQPRRIEVRDGLTALREETHTISLTGFLGAPAPDASLTLLSYEGDADQPGTTALPERVAFNGTTLSDALNPATNPFNSTSNVTGGNATHGFDLDGGSVASLVTPGARTATLAVTTGTDLVILQAVVTSVSVVLVDVTPNGLPAPVDRVPGTQYSQLFAVENPSIATDLFDLLAAGVTGQMRIDSITGPGITTRLRPDSARVQLAAGTTTGYTVWYTVPVGAPVTGEVRLTARAQSRPTLATDDGWVPVRRRSPQMTLTKSVSPNTGILPGALLTYSIAVSNVGVVNATQVNVWDAVPERVVFRVGSVQQTLPAGITATPRYTQVKRGELNLAQETWAYVPVSGGCGAPSGYDACVTYVQWTLAGAVAASAAGTFTFGALVR